MDVDEMLVSLMEKHPNLYNKRHEFYKDNRRKRNSWADIAKSVGLDVATAKRRWENLRDRFVRVYREYTEYPPLSNNSSGKNNKFKLFDRMLWLAPHIRKRRITSSIMALRNNTNSSQYSLTDDTQSSETHESVNIKAETQSNVSNLTYQDTCLEEDGFLSSTTVAIPRQNEIDNKADHYFMMSVIQDCQNMPPRKKLKFKRDVLGLLDKYLYDDK
jgi:hypothetical protein